MRTKILAVILLSGCGIAGIGDAPKATVHATWSIKKADGTPDVCPPNYTSVKLVAQAYKKPLDIPTGDPFTKVFDCAAGKGSIEVQTSGDEPGVCKDGTCSHDPATEISGKYIVTAVITEASGTTYLVPSFSQTFQLDKGDASADFTLYPNAGFRLYNWSLDAKTDGRLLGCTEAGVDQLTITSTQVMDNGDPDPGGASVTDSFPCDNDPDETSSFGAIGAGQSSPMPFGYYATAIKAFSHGQLVGSCENCTDAYKVDNTTLRWSDVGSSVYWHEGVGVTVDNR